MPARFDRYEPDNRSFGKHMRTEDVRGPAEAVAEIIMDLAQARAGRSTDNTAGHVHYADSFRIEKVDVMLPAGPFNNLRSAVKIVNDSPQAPPLEFGGGPASSHKAPLRTAALLASATPGVSYNAAHGDHEGV